MGLAGALSPLQAGAEYPLQRVTLVTDMRLCRSDERVARPLTYPETRGRRRSAELFELIAGQSEVVARYADGITSLINVRVPSTGGPG